MEPLSFGEWLRKKCRAPDWLGRYNRGQIGNMRWRVELADVDCDIAAITAKIGNVVFEVAYVVGRRMTLDKAVAYALEAN